MSSLPVGVLLGIYLGLLAGIVPNADERLEAGDVAYLLGRPAALRRLDER